MRTSHPRLETERLSLRLVVPADALSIQELASAREISDTMISVPHPYPAGEAERWIEAALAENGKGRALPLAIEARDEGRMVGIAEVRALEPEHGQAELSFWIGRPWWGRGYATEAVGATIDHALGELNINRLYAHHMQRNPASGRVLEKLGFAREGLLRQRVRKWGVYEDVVLRALLRDDWERGNEGASAGPRQRG